MERAPVHFPCQVKNYSREVVIVNNEQEMLDHLLRTPHTINPITLILSGRVLPDQKVSPGLFISEASFSLITLFTKCKRYGIPVIYEDSDIPNGVLEAFDEIQSALDSCELARLKTLDKGNGKNHDNRL